MFVVAVNQRTKRALRLFILLVCVVAVARLGLAVTTGEIAVMGRLKPVENVAAAGDRVALTFDLSWGEVVPPKVLAVLREYELACTFFLSGPWAASHPDLVAELVRDGHEVASHGYRHVNMTTLTEEGIRDNITRAEEAITAAAGQRPRFLRPPNGDYNDLVIKTAEALGYQVINWGLDSHDWMNPGVSYIVDRVLEKTEAGDVVLLHASDTCKQTDEALPAIIEGLQAKGFQLVTVSELVEGSAAGE